MTRYTFDDAAADARCRGIREEVGGGGGLDRGRARGTAKR